MQINDDGLLERSERVEMVDEPDTEPPVIKKRVYKTKAKVEKVVEVAVIPPPVVEEVIVEEVQKVVKVKKPRTEAQIASFEKAKATRDANRKKSMELKEQQTEEKVLTKVLKEKIIRKKATKISKLKNELINQIIESDSEEEQEQEPVVVQRRRSCKSVSGLVKPRITFV